MPSSSSPTRPICQKFPKYFWARVRTSHRGRHRHERVPAPRRHLNHVELVLQHLVGQAGHPHLVEGLPLSRFLAMALLAKEEDKEAGEVDGGIGGAISAPLLRLQRLLA